MTRKVTSKRNVQRKRRITWKIRRHILMFSPFLLLLFLILLNRHGPQGSNLVNDGELFLATMKSPCKSDWILDFGGLFHMYLVRENIASYQACNRDIVKTSNGVRSEIAGLGCTISHASW